MEYSNNAYQPPDLASVLRTLSALAPAQGQPPAHQQPSPYQSEAPPKNDELEEGEYDPADDYLPAQPLPPPSQPHHQPQPPTPLPTPSSHALPPTPAPPNPASQTYQLQPLPSPAPPPKSSTDPSTITTWPRALHHILHLTTTSPSFLPSIRTLFKTQHRHEREWHAQRLALQSRLDSRAESRSKLDNVLAALGGKVSTAGKVGQGGKKEGEDGEGGEEEDKEREIERFDRKVWKAQAEMVRAMGRDLGKLGVPGFGEGFKGGEEEGRVLRGRVVGLLEDLCQG